MKKSTKRMNIIIYIVLFLVAAFFVIAPFFESDISTEIDNGYKVNNYNIEYVVNNDNTINIEEKIDVTFLDNRHGIYRNVPIYNTLYTKKGRISQSVKFYDFEAFNENYGDVLVYEEKGNKVIRFGNEYSTFRPGQTHQYHFTYSLDLGKDFIKEKDFLYLNINGIDWGSVIDKLTYKITMPKEFDTSKLYMYEGKYGESNIAEKPTVVGNVISGSKTNIAPHNALTIKLDLPENYFNEAKQINYKFANIPLIISVVGIVLAIFMLLIKPKKTIMVSPVEFYPPNGYNPVDIASIYNGKIEMSDITSLIVYFASKGYLKIKTNEKDEMIVTKVKDLEEGKFKNYEILVFKKLFETRETVNLSTVLDSDRTNDDFNSKGLAYAIYDATKYAEKQKPCKHRYNMTTFAFMIILLAISVIAPLTYIAGALYYDGLNLFVFIGTLGTIIAMGMLLFTFNFKTFKEEKKFRPFLLIMFGLYFALFVFGMYSMTFNYGYDAIGIKTIISFLSVATMIIAFIVLDLSKKSTELLGRVLGFKNFIMNCEKSRMDLLLKDDPNYFFDILPYAYVFGITNEFINRFEHLGYKIPSNTAFSFTNYLILDSIIDNNLNHLAESSRNIAKNISSGGLGGGGFSIGGGGGGGFSGGGFGGGGGGSW